MNDYSELTVGKRLRAFAVYEGLYGTVEVMFNRLFHRYPVFVMGLT